MYTSRTGLILGFHGTDKAIVETVLRGEQELMESRNPYDWLGNGIYFRDNSPSRALEWAIQQKSRPGSTIENPAVIGAIIDLGKCLDLLDYSNIQLLKNGYDEIVFQHSIGVIHSIPENKLKTKVGDFLHRELDCAVIETIHTTMRRNSEKEYDSVRGVFWEGGEVYPTAGFKEKNHIQICVRNMDCIKGYFRPLERFL